MPEVHHYKRIDRPWRRLAEILPVMEKHYPRVIAQTALVAYLKAHEFYAGYVSPDGSPPPKWMTDGWKAYIDAAAADAMASGLSTVPFNTGVIIGEGAKEVQYAGVAAATGIGDHGHPQHRKIIAGVDVVDGTTRLSQLKPGAISIMATVPGKEGFGIRKTKEGEHYLIKFIGPPEANGVVDMKKNSHEKNLRALIKRLGIEPNQLTQVTLDPKKKGRECNREFVEAAKRVGVTLKIIDDCDFTPSIHALTSPEISKYTIVVGRGGAEEGTLSAVAARAVGGFMQAREYDPKKGERQDGKVLNLNELVSANREHAMVSTAFITDDEEWFHKQGVRLDSASGHYIVTTMVVTHKGVEFQEHVI